MEKKIHELKTWEIAFNSIKSGEKCFEYRKNDRNFEVGDILHLLWYQPEKGYNGEAVYREVEYIIEGGQFGIPEGYCVMGLKNPEIDQLKTRVEVSQNVIDDLQGAVGHVVVEKMEMQAELRELKEIVSVYNHYFPNTEFGFTKEQKEIINNIK